MQGQHVVLVILHGVKGHSLTQANLEPKTKICIYIYIYIYIYKKFLCLPNRVGHSHSSKQAVSVRLCIVMSPRAQISSSGAKCLLVSSI